MMKISIFISIFIIFFIIKWKYYSWWNTKEETSNNDSYIIQTVQQTPQHTNSWVDQKDKHQLDSKENTTGDNTIFERITTGYNHEYDIFPAPKNINITFIQDNITMPRDNNISYIYLKDKQFWNSNSWIKSDSEIILKWKIINSVEFIEIIWDGNMQRVFLDDYIPWDWNFIYNISENIWNLVEWKNKYLIRWYAYWDKVYERILHLEYFWNNSSNQIYLEKSLKPISIDIFNDINKPSYHKKFSDKNDDQLYTTAFKYNYIWEQKLILNDSQILTVVNSVGDNNEKKYEFFIENNQKKSNSIETHLHINYLIHKDNWDIFFTVGWWFEWITSYYYYNNWENKLYDIFKDFVEFNDKKRAYNIFAITETTNDRFTIKESKYCCDMLFNYNWHEIITFDLSSKEIISRFPISKINDEFIHLNINSETKYISQWIIIPKDYWYDLLEESENKTYVITNPDIINNYIIDNDITWIYNISADIKIYNQEYIEIIELYQVDY